MYEADDIAKKVMALVFTDNSPDHSGYFLTHPVPKADQELEGMLVAIPHFAGHGALLMTLTLGEQIPPRAPRFYQLLLRAKVPEAVETAESVKYGLNTLTKNEELETAKARAFDLAEPLVSAVFYKGEHSEQRLIQLICLLPLRSSTGLTYLQRQILRGLESRK